MTQAQLNSIKKNLQNLLALMFHISQEVWDDKEYFLLATLLQNYTFNSSDCANYEGVEKHWERMKKIKEAIELHHKVLGKDDYLSAMVLEWINFSEDAARHEIFEEENVFDNNDDGSYDDIDRV
jgi:hypothetical protein